MGARKRQPIYPLRSKLRTLGTLAVLIAMLGAVVTSSRASAEVDGTAYAGEYLSNEGATIFMEGRTDFDHGDLEGRVDRE